MLLSFQIYDVDGTSFGWMSILVFYFIYFTNGRYIECLSLTYATSKSKTYKKNYT